MKIKEVLLIVKFLISSTELFISVFFLWGMMTSLLVKFEKKILNIVLLISASLGVLGGLIEFIIKTNSPKKTNIAMIRFNRELIVAIALFSFIGLILSIIYLLKKSKVTAKFEYLMTGSFSVILFLTFLYISPQAFIKTGDFVYFGEDIMSTMALLRAVGFIIGVVICLVGFFSIKKVASYMTKVTFSIFSTLYIGVFFIDYVLKAVKALQRLKLLAFNDFVFEIMIFADAHAKSIIYVGLFVGVCMMTYVVLNNRKVKGEFPNRALIRKEKARMRRARRWSWSLFTTILISVLLLSVVNYFEYKPVELTPPQPYEITENKILIKFEDIDDGHLHRFSYKTPNGYDVRFIAVKKPNGSSFGVGLDACEICGIAGYFERGDDVVCKMCDVVMNKNTIGFKGGCNPIPFPYVVEDSMIIIDIEDLIREEKRFR